MNILNNITLLFCNFNTNELSKKLIKSLFKHLGCKINVTIFDNGTVELCDDEMKSMYNVIDNSFYKITGNQNQLSRNHCATVDYALKNVIKTKYVILCDSDILFKPNIKYLIEKLDNLNDFDAVGEIQGFNDRLMPMFCIINVEKFNREKLNYYDKNRCMNNFTSIFDENGLWIKDIIDGNKWFGDTGSSFLCDILKNKWNIYKISMGDYIEHYGRGSFEEKTLTKNEWLNLHKNLWD